jgi:hypothetical protein
MTTRVPATSSTTQTRRRAAPEVREKAGEFVNRMNFGAKRKFWEIDCDSGELRLTSYTDTLVGPLINGSHSR